MGEKFKYYLILHLIVLIFGFTGILGDQLSISSDKITFFRTGISFASLLLLGFFIKQAITITKKDVVLLILTGFIVGIHWYTFFQAIKESNVSIALVCMASTTLFTSILEPIFFKRKFLLSEFILSFAIIGGIATIIGFESHYYMGILFGLISAFLAALFTVINGKFTNRLPSFSITKYEMLGGFLILTIIMAIRGQIEPGLFTISAVDWTYLLILGIVCTTFAFMVSVWIMKFITPFTVSMSVNMEPIYAIIIAVIIDSVKGTHKEEMSSGFYFGAGLILLSIFVNAYLKKRASDKIKKENLLEVK